MLSYYKIDRTFALGKAVLRVSIMALENERIVYHRAILNGEDVSDWHFKGEITEPHKGFQKWIGENQERIENAKSLPYWIKDNPKYVGGAAVVQQHTGHEAAKSETYSYKGHDSQLGHKPTKHGEQFLPIPMKPANLEEIQIINNRNRIAKLSGFTDDEISKMHPMVFDDANSGNVNAQIARNVDTRTNCQGCVVTFEARFLGIDVTATGYDNEEFRLLLEKDQTLTWRNKKGEHPKLTAEFTNEEVALAFLNGSEMARNGRYQLGINKWKYDEDGHILNLIRADGVTYIYDGQLKYRCELSDIFAGVDWSGKVELLRVDKLLLDERCIHLFKRR